MKKLKKWKVIEEKDISPSRWFPLFKHVVELPNGKTVDDYFLSKMGDVSMVVPVTTQKEIVFVRQYKHGAGEIIIELPAGRIKAGLDPMTVAKAELEEETGYRADKLEPLGVVYGAPSKDTFKVYGYLALDLDIQYSQKFDENEDIEVVKIPITEIDNAIKEGRIAASDTITFIKLA